MIREKQLKAKEADYLNTFWRLIHHWVVREGYRPVWSGEHPAAGTVPLTPDIRELYLVNNQGRRFFLIRVALVDYAYSRQIEEDCQRVLAKAVAFRQSAAARSLEVWNILLFPEGLVGDGAHAPREMQGRRTHMRSALMDLPRQAVIASGSYPAVLDEVWRDGPRDEQEEALEAVVLFNEVQAAAHSMNRSEYLVLNRARPRLTYLFLAVNVAIFILMTLSGGTTNPVNLVRWGAKYGPLIVEGEWWRLITPNFIHIGLMHLMFNSLALYVLGPVVERIYGNGRFLVIYLISGVLGVSASFAFSPSLSAGASAAIFGLFGALLYFGQNYRNLFFRTMGTEILVLLGINLAFGFFSGAVDNYAHLGGLLGGYVASWMAGLPERSRWMSQVTGAAAYLLLLTLLISIGIRSVPGA